LNALTKGCINVSLYPDDTYYGLNVHEYRDMVIHLLVEGCLNDTVTFGATRAFRENSELEVERTLAEMSRNQPITIHINHRGRLRLARLREELTLLCHLASVRDRDLMA
jgi:hypothetical protein